MQTQSVSREIQPLADVVSLALEEARRQGASECEADASLGRGLSVSVRLREVDTLEYQRDRGLAVTVYFGKRKGSASTADLSTSAVRETVEKACAIARYTAEDPYAGLVEPEALAREIPDLDLDHPWDVTPELCKPVTPHDDRKAHEAGAEPPSKSARKRAAHAAQDLGEALTALRDAELEALELPEALLDAIRAARRITSRAAAVRQRQYIGRLMREVDLESIRAALATRDARTRRDAERFRQITAWRERLIAEGPPALTELSRRHPQIDRDEWARRIEAARAEHVRPGSRAGAARELFRALRALFDTMPR